MRSFKADVAPRLDRPLELVHPEDRDPPADHLVLADDRPLEEGREALDHERRRVVHLAEDEVLELVRRLVGDDREGRRVVHALPGALERDEPLGPGLVEAPHPAVLALVGHELLLVR